ncbi:MAG: hypothetical protein K0R14_891 [Burkholderiales bacterium]|jgi:hypothetical protein|nr:hypothetical protein [Burkholderiales bacterium]
MKTKFSILFFLGLAVLYSSIAAAEDREEFAWEVYNATPAPIKGRFATWSKGGEKSVLFANNEWLQPNETIKAPTTSTLYGGLTNHWCIEVSDSQHKKGRTFAVSDKECNITSADHHYPVVIVINGEPKRSLTATIKPHDSTPCEVDLETTTKIQCANPNNYK